MLAEYPSGSFLENLTVLDDGAIVFTNYFAKTLEIIEPGKPARVYASLPAHPVSVLRIGDTWLVAAHGEAFVSGPGFLETQQFLILSSDGALQKTVPAPEARFLNGMVGHADGEVLVADSVAATIWRFDPRSGRLTAWLRASELSQDPAQRAFQPGANGLKRNGDRLIVSNSSRGTLSYVVNDSRGLPASGVELLARVGAIDDFIVEPDGAILFTTHSAALKRWRQGETTDVLASGCDGCTAVAPLVASSGRTDLIVLTTGALPGNSKGPAKVLRIRPAS